jgi:uroporphyrinogen-III synthase
MQDNKPYILSTQPLKQRLIDKAAGKGITIHSLSFIETRPIMNAELEKMIGRLSSSNLNAAFTSLHAVETVKGFLAGRKPAWTIFCTGPATSRAVEAYFGKNTIAAEAPSASELADVIIATGAITEIVFFCGNQRRKELPEKLSLQGIVVQEVHVYTTETTPRKISRYYDGISFFSPGAVHSFFSGNTIDGNTLFFAIGKTTADTIAGYCGNEVILARSPGKEILIEQAIEFFQNKIISHPGDSRD